MCNQMVMSEISDYFHVRFDQILILPINIIGDELRLQSWIFDMFILDHIDQELHSLECLELIWLMFRIFRQDPC